MDSGAQGYLAHTKTPTALETSKTLGIGLRQGPRGVRFLVREVALYGISAQVRVAWLGFPEVLLETENRRAVGKWVLGNRTVPL